MPVKSDNPPQILTLYQWKGINQSASRGLIDDQELHWMENFFPIAEGQLRSAWGPSAPLYTASAGSQILRIFCANITGTNPSIFVFLDSGLVDRYDLNTGSITPLGQIWQPIAPNYYCDLKLWKPTEVGSTTGQVGGAVIGSPQGLYAVDGNDAVTAPGQTAPLWLTNNATTDASGNTIIMPSGLPGIYAMEVYQQRLWVMGQTVISFSAPSNGALFDSADGGGSFGYFGDKLTVSYTDLAASAGFLYLFGDSSIDVIANIQLVGQGTVYSPYTTAFQLANVDPQNGQRFYSPVGHWGPAFVLLNGSGIYGFQGQQAQLISQKIINLYSTLRLTGWMPTLAPCDIFGRRWMLVNGMFTDPWGVQRSMLLCWDGQVWVVASQRYSLTQIVHREQYSTIHAYGTDGNAIYQLFARPDNALPKLVSTKAYKGPNLLTIKQWKRVYLEMKDNLSPPGPAGVTLVGTQSTADGGIQNGREDIAFTVPPGGFGTVPQPTFGAGISAWVDLRSLSPDFVLERMYLTYDERALFGA